jgi:hypothetical protein
MLLAARPGVGNCVQAKMKLPNIEHSYSAFKPITHLLHGYAQKEVRVGEPGLIVGKHLGS